MKYAAYTLLVLALGFGLCLYRRRLIRKRIHREKHLRSLRTTEAEGDPFDDRIEFHCIKRR
jgi:hypothetical protein